MRLVLGCSLLVLCSCAMQDTTTPVPQADTQVFGRIVEIREVTGEPGVWEVDVKTGMPESLQAVMRAEGKFVPEMERALTARARVTPDTVCIFDLEPTDLDAFRVGQEVALVPVPGTSALSGTSRLTLDTAELYSFRAYETRFLPRALGAIPAAVHGSNSPDRVNSAGFEASPIPVGDGRAVYFAAGLVPPFAPGLEPRGAVRDGMRDGETLAAWAVGGYRAYRTEWTGSSWSRPEAVVFPGLAPDVPARVTWVSDAETDCLLELKHADGTLELLAARRPDARAPWGAPEPAGLAGATTGDGQRFGPGDGAAVWTVYDGGSSNLWLAMPGAEGQVLEPRINTGGPEWAPRVGPNTSLYFCRAQRQLLFAGGAVSEVRLPGRQRRPLLEAAPADRGRLLFFRIPRYTPGHVDWDIAVATREADGWGKAVRLDDFTFEDDDRASSAARRN